MQITLKKMLDSKENSYIVYLSRRMFLFTHSHMDVLKFLQAIQQEVRWYGTQLAALITSGSSI